MADVTKTIKTNLKSLSIKDLIALLTFVAPLLKSLFEVIKEFEIPGATGEEKKAAVMGFMETIIDKCVANNPSLEWLKPYAMDFIDTMVDGLVWAYNKLKKFAHEVKE